MKREILEKEITKFRDDLKEYQEIIKDIWVRKGKYSRPEEINNLIKTKENPLREKLIEKFGRLEKHLIKIGISMNGVIQGRVFPVFESALSGVLFNNPVKGYGLSMAIQMAIKAVGVIKSLDSEEFEKLKRKIITIFISHNFADKNKEIIQKFKDFISKFDVLISLGSEVDTISVSEKVKNKIDNADIILSIMTKDKQDDEGNWFPSKWILEELSYALGNKNKEIIRIIEEGCDNSGCIFGDKEFISFNRENISDSLIKLAEVLNKKI